MNSLLDAPLAEHSIGFAPFNHLPFAPLPAIEKMESREDLFQLTQANAMHSKLHPTTSERDICPTGRETTNKAGLNKNAMASRAAVVVYEVPVYFWWG